jgi:hypothetical protein
MDEADAADLTVEQHLKRALAVRCPTLPATGTCYGCEEDIEGGLRFHNVDCRNEWERAERARKINGRME